MKNIYHVLSPILLTSILLLVFLLGMSFAALTNHPLLPSQSKNSSVLCDTPESARSRTVGIPFSPYVHSITQPLAYPNEPDFCLTIPVLMYHHIQPAAIATMRNQASLTVDNELFESQIAYLSSRGYRSITTDQLLHALLSHTSLPEKSIVLTFDDGYEDNYTYAYPTLKKYGFTGNFAVPTGLLGTHASTNEYFTWEQLSEMVHSGVINAINHTQTHYPVGMGDETKTTMEIQTPQQELRTHLGTNVTTFVYPYGYYQPWVFPLIKKQGLLGAFTTKEGTLACQSSIMALPRTRIGNVALSSYGL